MRPWHGRAVSYTVRIFFLNQGEQPASERMDSTFASLQEAWDAGTAEVLAYQLRSVEAAFQVLDANDRIVEVTAKQIGD